MENKSPSVNLLKTKGNNFGSKFISWILTIGRMVIILTETVALSAFLYRFILDRQIIDQKTSINQKAAQIKAFEDGEKNFRNLQERLNLISKLQDQPATMVLQLKDVVGILPPGLQLNSLQISQETIRIDMNVGSVASLSTFVNKLKQNPSIESVSIDKIENKTVIATITVSITAKLKISTPSLTKRKNKL